MSLPACRSDPSAKPNCRHTKEGGGRQTLGRPWRMYSFPYWPSPSWPFPFPVAETRRSFSPSLLQPPNGMGLRPIAITMRFPQAAGTEESRWQELVVRKLGIDDWRIISVGDDLDYLNAIATSNLLRDGLSFAPNAHSIVPVSRALGSGTVVTGIGGDDLLAVWRWRWRLAALRRPWTDGLRRGPRTTAVLAFGTMPEPVRRWVFRRRTSRQLRDEAQGFRWLTPAGRRAVLPGLVDGENQPPHWGEFVHWTAPTTDHRRNKGNGQSIGRARRRQGIRAFARARSPGGDRSRPRGKGWVNRSEAMIDIAGDRLPLEILTRKTKASFVDVFWGPRTREFAQNWDGTGVDADLVDVEALRKEWCSERPDFRSTLLLQSAWLSGQAHSDAASGGSTRN